VQNKVKPRLIKNQNNLHSLEKIDHSLKKLIFIFQQYKQLYKENSTTFTSFWEQIHNTTDFGYRFSDKILRFLPFLHHFLFGFFDFSKALYEMAYATEKFHKIF